MTFSNTEMKELGRSTGNDTQHNIVDSYPQVCLRHLADERNLGERVHTHTHTHTHIHKHKHTHTLIANNKTLIITLLTREK